MSGWKCFQSARGLMLFLKGFLLLLYKSSQSHLKLLDQITSLLTLFRMDYIISFLFCTQSNLSSLLFRVLIRGETSLKCANKGTYYKDRCNKIIQEQCAVSRAQSTKKVIFHIGVKNEPHSS